MTAPIINGQAFGPSSSAFASSVDITVTLGSNAGRWIRVKALSFDPFALGFGAGYISSAVLDPGGANVALTLDADHDLNGSTPSYGLGANGRIAWFRLDSIGTPSMPTGTVTLRVTMADANGKPLVEAVWGDGCGAAGSSGLHSVGSGTSWASAAMTATTNDLAVGIGFFDCGGTPSGAATITGTSSTAIAGSGGQTNYQRVFAASKSAVNPTLAATIGNNSFTPAWFGRTWVVQGTVSAAVLTGSITEDDDAPTGSMAPAAPSSITGSITEDDDLPTGNLGAVAGTINIGPWKSDVGMPLPSTTIPKITFLRDSDGLQVLTLLNQVTSSSPTAPMIPVTNGALAPGLKYWVASWDAAGVNYGFEPYIAA